MVSSFDFHQNLHEERRVTKVQLRMALEEAMVYVEKDEWANAEKVLSEASAHLQFLSTTQEVKG